MNSLWMRWLWLGATIERGAIEAFLTVVDRGPAALVLAGEAGIGKTILWEVGVNAAVRRFGWVLICRGVEAEASLSFAGLSELLAPVLADTMPSLSAPRRRALEVALLLAEPGSEVPNAHAIGLAVFDVLNVLAAQGPVVVAVDDLQWMDVASAGVLHVALRRLPRRACRAAGHGSSVTRRGCSDRPRTRVHRGVVATAIYWSTQCGCA